MPTINQSTRTPAQRRLRSRIAAHARRSREDPAPTGWGVLLALLGGWGIALRLMLLLCLCLCLCLPIAAAVVIVALIVIHSIGAGALVAGGGIQWLLTRRRRCAEKS